MVVRSTSGAARPFVGRDHELKVAAEILADTDHAGVALIGGESGLGKTRLVEEIIGLAGADVNAVRGGAVPRATPIPFELIRSALGPDIVGVVNSDVTPADQVRALAETIRSAHTTSTIFVFEDIHWADPESLDVVDRLLVAGPLGASVLITYRPNALLPGDPTSVFLQRSERRRNVAQFRLEPLRRDEVGEYLQATGRTVDAATVQHVHNRTGGNPLLLSELVASTANDADLTGGLPWTLAEMLRPEIERLPGEQRALAEAVSVLGSEVGFDLLAAALDSTEGELLSCLRALVDAGVLVESGPDQFSFRHDMVREAVAESLFTREHRRIHAAVHDALLKAGSDDVVALVAHATGAGRNKQAADAARDAATQSLAEGRTHQALAFAEQALLVHTDDVGLLRTAVVAGWMVGQDRAALHHLDRWDEVGAATPAERAETLHHRVRLLWEEQDVGGADRAAAELAALIDSMEPGVAQAQAMADVAQHLMLSGEDHAAIAMADRSIGVADTIGAEADGARRQARAERSSARLSTEADRGAVIAELLEIVDDAEGAGDFVIASRALHNVPIQHPSIDAASHVERMRIAGEKAGMSCMATESYRRYLLAVALLDGDRAAFDSLLDAAIEDLGPNAELTRSLVYDAIDRSDFADARRRAERMSATLESHHYSASWRSGLLALISHHEGDSSELASWFDDVPRKKYAEHFALELALPYLSSFLNAGLAPQLATFFQRDIIEQMHEPAYLGVRAELAGDFGYAEEMYALALEEGMCRWVLEQTELHLARARIAPHLQADPGRHLASAASRISNWPSRKKDYVVSLLGVGIADDSTGSLTPREREVAALVERGLTNGGIADTLFISTKTASVHVSNILSKLAMSSRTEIASWVARGGLD